MKKKISPSFLAIIIALMATFIGTQLNVFGFFDSSPTPEVETQEDYLGLTPRLESEAGMYRPLKESFTPPIAGNTGAQGLDQKSPVFYRNRAYPGAPPTIPHEVEDVVADGGFENCLHCHRDGSYAPKLKAYAPKTPHPEYTSCRQCHVPKTTLKKFKPTAWKKVSQLKTGRRHLPGSPPAIPHSLQLRENCLSCHFGPGSRPDLRVTHPERTSCRQCHAQTKATDLFKRTGQ